MEHVSPHVSIDRDAVSAFCRLHHIKRPALRYRKTPAESCCVVQQHRTSDQRARDRRRRRDDGARRCAARNLAERSLHAGIFFWALTTPRARDLLAREMVEHSVDGGPLCFNRADAAAVEAALVERLVDKIGKLSLAHLLERHRIVT